MSGTDSIIEGAVITVAKGLNETSRGSQTFCTLLNSPRCHGQISICSYIQIKCHIRKVS